MSLHSLQFIIQTANDNDELRGEEKNSKSLMWSVLKTVTQHLNRGLGSSTMGKNTLQFAISVQKGFKKQQLRAQVLAFILAFIFI